MLRPTSKVPEQLTCWPSKTGTKMKQLVLLSPLKVCDKVLDASQECLQACTPIVSTQFDTYMVDMSR